MAKEVSHEGVPKEKYPRFSSYGNEEKTMHDEKYSSGSKIMSNDKIVLEKGCVKKRNGKGIDDGEDVKRISAERERRRKLADLYGDLQAVIPHLSHLPSKVDNATIIEEAISSIKSLEQTLHNLQKEKLNRSQIPLIINNEKPLLANNDVNLDNISSQSSKTFKTWASSNVTLTMYGIDAHISICSLKKPAIFTTICFILQKHNLELISAEISSDRANIIFMIHVRGNVPPVLADGFPYEEMYKKVVAQIILALG